MNKDELIARVNEITNVRIQYKEIYKLLQELNIPFQKTTCVKCLRDYLNIIKEELGIIDSAAESSSFNSGYKYVWPFKVAYTAKNGKKYLMDNHTPIDIIEEFIQTHKRYYKKLEE